MQTRTTIPRVSIIIPTRDSQRTIGRCLQSIDKQTCREIETLIVDCYSKDRTLQICRQFNAKVFLLSGERSAAKNYAAKKTSGEFLLFIDSDMELNPKTVEECLKKCTEDNVHGVIMPEKYVSSGLIGECRGKEKRILSSANGLVEIPRFIRKEVFLKLGGFDEKLVCGEDFHFFQKFKACGYEVGRIRTELAHFEGSPSLYDVVAKGYHYGRSLPDLMDRTPLSTVKRYGSLRLVSFQRIGTQTRSMKILLVFLSMKLVEYFGYFWGVCVRLVDRSFVKKGFDKMTLVVKEKGRIILGLAFLVLIALIIFRNFFLSNDIPAGNDTFGWISREYIYGRDFRWLFIWRPYSFGFVEGINLMDLFFMLTNLASGDAVLTIKVFLFLCYLLAGFAMYAFTYRYTHSNLAAISAGLVYTLNQWFFSQITEGHVDLIFSYAFAPLLFLLVDRALTKGSLKSLIFSALGLTVFLTGFHPNSVVIYGVFLVFFLAVYLFFPNSGTRITGRVKNSLKFLAVCGIIGFLLTAFFTLPFFMNVKAYFMTEEYKYPIEEAEFFSVANMTEAFVLKATEGGGYIEVVDIRNGFGLPDFPVQDFLFFIFLVSYSAILIRRDRYTVFFLIASIISAFISKGTNSPLGTFFTWAWLNVPHFAVFRRPSRWETMTVFSNAFFVGLFIDLVHNHIIKTSAKSEQVSLKIKWTNSTRKLVDTSKVSVDFLDKCFRAFQKSLRFVGVTLIIMILLSGLVSCWFFFYNGLFTYKLPKDYEKPFNWVAEQPGDYKIITVNKSPEEWANGWNAITDFAFVRMLTEVGWVHDIGCDSSIIHDKPVLQDGGWEPASKTFVDYFRRSIVNNNMTDNFLKIFGSFNYKYVVIPPYSSERVRNFILNQKGGHIVYNENGSLIVENEYFTPHFFSPEQLVEVVGGSEAFMALCKIDSFRLNETALVFMNPSEAASFLSAERLNSSAVVLVNGEGILDVALSSPKDSAGLIAARNFAVPSDNVTGYWIGASFWRDSGKLVLGGETLTTKGQNTMKIPFSITTDGEYEAWIRVAFAADRGKLSLYLDDEFLEELYPTTSYWTALRWVKIASLNLKKGNHFLTLRNDGSGYNDVDAICVAEKSLLEERLHAFTEKLGSFSGRTIYLLQPEDFLQETPSKWTIASEPYEGNVLVGENALINISPEGNANASSTQVLQNEKIDPSFAIDGNMVSRWASQPFENASQWLELNWTKPHEMVAVKAYFESAYAQDYLIQTWDEEKSVWVTQTNITGNNELTRIHFFEEPVNTTRLRIYVTSFSNFDMVSLYEMEVYEKSAITSDKFSVYHDGRFRCFIRASSTPENGKIYLKLGDESSEISLFNASSQYQWFDAGTFNLTAGNQELSLGALGRASISQIVLYSLSENENATDLSELFAKEENTATIKCDQLNPCTYKLQINADKPFLLVFSEVYNPLWKAIVDNEEISAFPVYSFLNGFFINKTGNFTMTIYFTGQNYVDTGLKITSASFLISMVIVLTPSRALKKLASKIRPTREA